jgi:hypothetical protein
MEKKLKKEFLKDISFFFEEFEGACIFQLKREACKLCSWRL